MQISKNFSLEELTSSARAKELNIDNTPTQEAKASLVALVVNVLQPIRDIYGNPIIVNSGYRSTDLNKAVKGSNNSQHMKGEAADITAGNPAKNKDLFLLIKESGIVYDQLIDESGYSWIHISFSKGKNRKQILHL